MYFRMLKRDLKDKPGLNIVAFIFMIAAVMFMVIGSTLLYALLGGEKKTYEKCHTSDGYFTVNADMSDRQGLVDRFMDDLDEMPIVTGKEHIEKVFVPFSNIEVVGYEGGKVHYSSGVYVTDMPDKYDIPIDFDNKYFEVPNGCVAVSQTFSNRLGVEAGDKLRLTTQFGNTYEYVVSEVYKNPATAYADQFYLSDRDKELFYNECPQKIEVFVSEVDIEDGDYINTLRDYYTDQILKYKDYGAGGNASKVLFLTNDGLFAIIVSTCMLVVAVAVMAMTMITIDFSLKSAIKREEREIGMMKAIGVWSLSYKTLFIVKYLVFAIIGGLIGLPAGFVASKLLFNKFVMHIMYPDVSMMIIIGAVASITTVALIILFSFFALRRMSKISVIDAIHGENRGERFAAVPGLFLNSKKHISVPLFMALSDILRGFKRYILLILAFVLGITIVLFVVRLNDTIMTTQYAQNYFQQGDLDFVLTIEDSYYDKLISGTGSFEGVMDLINKNFEDNDIPAKVVVRNGSPAIFQYDGGEVAGMLQWQDAPSSEMIYLEGNPPKLKNEVATGYYFANERNIKIGDTIKVTYDKYADDHTTFNKVSEEFIVTAFVDQYGKQNPTLFMGDEFEGSRVTETDYFSCSIDAPKSEHEKIIQKMQDLYPNEEIKILRNSEIMPYYLTGYQEMFRLIISIVSVICVLMLSLLTALYENIFIDEETADIALLKSMGFGRGTIRAWHFLRLLILSIFSLILTYIFLATGGNYLIGLLFKSIMRSKEFHFTILPFNNFIVIPLCIVTGLAIVIYLMTRMTNKIQIWKVRNE